MIESIIGENIISTVVGLALLSGMLLGVFITLLFMAIYEEGQKRKKGRARVMCPQCSRRYLDLIENE